MAMDSDDIRQPETSAKNSLPSCVQRLAYRLTPEEATKAAIRMLSAYPETAKSCSKDYLMALAEVLCNFPREVAVQACSPIHGIPRQHKDFRPTAGQAVEWCEAATKQLRIDIERERERLFPTPAIAYSRPPALPDLTEEQLAERRAHVKRVLGNLVQLKSIS